MVCQLHLILILYTWSQNCKNWERNIEEEEAKVKVCVVLCFLKMLKEPNSRTTRNNYDPNIVVAYRYEVCIIIPISDIFNIQKHRKRI